MEKGTRKGRVRGAFAAIGMAMAIGLAAGRASADVAKSEVAGTVDLNTASVADLAALPGIGESKARAIVAWREATPFRSVDELRDVKGIGDKMLEKLRPHLAVSQVAAASGGARAKAADTSAQGAASPARAASQAAQAGKAEAAGR
ncbi:MAG: ComEA family DNA-binding protein [Alphaproteobacteria bacterium]